MYKIKQVLVDENNQNILNTFFSEITPYYNKYWKVKENELYGLYDMSSLTPILKCEWEKITIFETGFLVFKSGLCGWYDTQGNCILPCIYQKISEYDFGLIAKQANAKVGAFNYDGSTILSCCWDKITPYPKALIAYRNRRSTAFDYSGIKIER